MPIDRQAAIADIDKVLATTFDHGGTSAVSQYAALEVAAIERWAPEGSSYRKSLASIDPFDVKGRGYMMCTAILKALRRDYHEGMVTSFEQLVHASLFEDLLAQGHSLLENGYRLASAVVAGAALEEHVRLLASAHGLALEEPNKRKPGKMRHREASALRDELYASKKVITSGERTQLQAWMDLRNEAAHNKDEFKHRTDGDVERMIEGTREFMVRHPA
jgi:hypothetical protein